MFGMGFTEILFIAVIAIIFLGPDKLPEAMVQIANFLTISKRQSTKPNLPLSKRFTSTNSKRRLFLISEL